MYRFWSSLLLMALLSGAAFGHQVPQKAKVMIKSPQNGAIVSSPFNVTFAIQGYLIAPAGENIHKAGHYHLLVDLKQDLDLDEPIPRDQHHIHYDRGETEAVLNLPPGKHTLQLVVGDEEHEPFEELMSEKITITVK